MKKDPLETFKAANALAGLKDFQRRTVDYVFRRLWIDDPAANRFLVADEVGLGKTLVARGIIAKTLEHLRDDVGRIDIVYVCSNAAIAQQNVNRLNVMDNAHFAMATRLTLLPLELHKLEENRVNFVSFTPGTTFDLRSSGGVWPERVVLYRLLTEKLPELERPLAHLLRGGVELGTFRRRIRNQEAPLNETLSERFVEEVMRDDQLLERLHMLCDRFKEPRHVIPDEDRRRQYALIGELRQRLAHVCIEALEPDLVILDEFQRFRGLLDGETEAAQLARSLMSQDTPEGRAVRVLMLSATPYKPLTFSTDDEDHYEDFIRVLEFLFEDRAKVARLKENLRVYRRGLYDREDDLELGSAKKALEQLLRSVMVRTERVGRTAERDAMLESRCEEAVLSSGDLGHALLLSEVARHVGASDTIEFWKSAPHLLHFMKEYQLKRKLEDLAEDPPGALLAAFRARSGMLLSRKQLQGYSRIDPANGRMRTLLEEMVEKGQWELLWVHASLPYLEPGGAYARVPKFTKALVFSSWTVVPDAISALCSYEVERRTVRSSGSVPRYSDLLTAKRPLLKFAETGGRLSGMPALALMYPSVALARAVDPLQLALEVGHGAPADVTKVKEAVARIVRRLLSETRLWPQEGKGPPDQRWYWAALAILDRAHLSDSRGWLGSAEGWRSVLGAQEDEKGLPKHVELFCQAVDDALEDNLGAPPADLVEVLVELALASPAICAARALSRVSGGLEFGSRKLSEAAAEVAGGFRTLFNLPESIALLRAGEDDAYWRLTLQHGIDGNLQAVLDEYAHQLKESLGLAGSDGVTAVGEIAQAMAEALSLRTALIAADEVAATDAGQLKFERFRFRTRYALRFGDLREEDQRLARAGTVRAAFNSPFRPFVLASTSVGQEGLDFHPYCHAVYHWNLPSNPVDLEQREGRVHRYKGHAVRKNVAQRWGLETLAGKLAEDDDPWSVLFRAAASAKPPGENDLVPFWIYEIENGAKVERRVPRFAFSREWGKLEKLQRGLAVYRLAFGQPRQEDLLSYLSAHEELPTANHVLDLQPPEDPTEPDMRTAKEIESCNISSGR
ncbi:MAG: DEAD/DEAH box helicase [Dehalococcoidia bacterium]